MSFNKSLFGIYSINILLGEKNFYELTLNLTNIKCKDGYQKCPSGRQCFIGDIIGCIPLSVKCDNPEEIIKHINRLVWEGVRVSGVHVETTFDGGYCYCESSKTNTDDVLKRAEEMLEKVKSAA